MTSNETAKKVSETAAKAEASLDKVSEKISSKVDKLVPESTKNTAKDLLGKADLASSKIEGVADHVEGMTDSVLGEQSGTTLEFQPQREVKISRLFIFRLLWIFPQYFILAIWGILAIIYFLVFYVLAFLTGKRNRWLWNALIRYQRHSLKRGMYLVGIIDRRPEIIVK